MKNIFIGDLDFGAAESSIRSLFETYRTVDRMNLVTDGDTGRSRGSAFVEMTDPAQADETMRAFNGFQINGRALNVNEACPKPGDGRGGVGHDGECQRWQSRW